MFLDHNFRPDAVLGHLCEVAGCDDRERIADIAVLFAGYALGAVRCRFDTARPLTPDERAEKRAALLSLWEAGCRNAVDETLFADIVRRRPQTASWISRVARRLPRKALLARAHMALKSSNFSGSSTQ